MHRLPLMLWVFLSISVFVLTSKGSAAVDLGDDWELAGAAYRQNYSSLPALAYARNTVRLEDRTAPRSEPKDLPQEQTATIWDEEERLVVSGENRYREVITVHWRSRVDGVFTSLSERLHLSREPCLPQGMHLGVGWKDSRRLASEWTVRRVLGKQLGSLTLSMQDLIEQPPSSMEIDDVGGVQCIKACYADVSGDVGNGSGSLYNIMIWMTFAPH